eukprot:Awhi_evm1s15803
MSKPPCNKDNVDNDNVNNQPINIFNCDKIMSQPLCNKDDLDNLDNQPINVNNCVNHSRNHHLQLTEAEQKQNERRL